MIQAVFTFKPTASSQTGTYRFYIAPVQTPEDAKLTSKPFDVFGLRAKLLTPTVSFFSEGSPVTFDSALTG